MSPFSAAASVSSRRSRFGGFASLASLPPAASFCWYSSCSRRYSLRLGPLRPIAGDVAHAGRRKLVLVLAIHPFRVLAAGHFQPLRRARKFHALVGDARDVFQHHGAAADEIRRAGQDLQGGDAAGQRGSKAGILRPDRMLGPDVRRTRRSRFVAIGVGFHLRARVDAEVGVDVDQTGRDPQTVAFDHAGIRGRLQVRADCLDFAVDEQNVSSVEPCAGAGQDGRVADERRCARGRLVGGRVERPGRRGWRWMLEYRGAGTVPDAVAVPRKPSAGRGCCPTCPPARHIPSRSPRARDNRTCAKDSPPENCCGRAPMSQSAFSATRDFTRRSEQAGAGFSPER